MAPGVHGSLQIVLWHEFEDVLEATTMVHGSPFDAFRQWRSLPRPGGSAPGGRTADIRWGTVEPVR